MANNKENTTSKPLDEILFEALDEHGFLFQEKCAEDLNASSSRIKWKVEAQEYPVATDVKETRIDIILTDTTNHTKGHTVYAVIECKRVKTNRGFWLFGNPSDVNYTVPLLLGLGGTSPTARDVHYLQPQLEFNLTGTYLISNWWISINQKGSSEKYDASPTQIENALFQACIGVSGLAQELSEQFYASAVKTQPAVFIPVVLTTAPLYVATYDVSNINLLTGSIDPNNIQFGPTGTITEEMPWLVVQYGASRNIAPDGWYDKVYATTPSELDQYHKRSVFVVNAKHIQEFFRKLHIL